MHSRCNTNNRDSLNNTSVNKAVSKAKAELLQEVKNELTSGRYTWSVIDANILSRLQHFDTLFLNKLLNCLIMKDGLLEETEVTFNNEYMYIKSDYEYYLDIQRCMYPIESFHIRKLDGIIVVHVYNEGSFIVLHNGDVHIFAGDIVCADVSKAKRNLLLGKDARTEFWQGTITLCFRNKGV